MLVSEWIETLLSLEQVYFTSGTYIIDLYQTVTGIWKTSSSFNKYNHSGRELTGSVGRNPIDVIGDSCIEASR